MTPDTTTTREYQVRWPDGLVVDAATAESAHDWAATDPPGAKVYARTITTTRTAWAEVVEAKEAQHG